MSGVENREELMILALAAASGGGVSPARLETALAAKQDRMEEITVAADGAVTQALAAGKSYHFTGALTVLTLSLGLAITGQPRDFTGPIDGTASFTVSAQGDGLTYQWQYKSLVDGRWYNSSTVAGYNTASMSITVTAARDGMQFRCRITDSSGSTVTSDPAAIHVGESSGGTAAPDPVAPRYHFDFVSGATAPTVTMPASVTMPDGFTVEANRRYEVDLLGGWGVAQSWAVSA